MNVADVPISFASFAGRGQNLHVVTDGERTAHHVEKGFKLCQIMLDHGGLTSLEKQNVSDDGKHVGQKW